MEGEKKASSVSDVGAWAMNVISSVGIIMANKQLMSLNGYAFTFVKALSYRATYLEETMENSIPSDPSNLGCLLMLLRVLDGTGRTDPRFPNQCPSDHTPWWVTGKGYWDRVSGDNEHN
ncbi:hypothetical protein TEA_009740 [Camellia sinensis var. sinensis]|uniref:Uncharacterized protein n=1 Tax=Camellia sinensis var. sinensis TaxID=542762 RepID=A0A4S4DK09_CAMSN|nr:hypothetical protein TEA_009740 [Camellia sinensis var. sinensis]